MRRRGGRSMANWWNLLAIPQLACTRASADAGLVPAFRRPRLKLCDEAKIM